MMPGDVNLLRIMHKQATSIRSENLVSQLVISKIHQSLESAQGLYHQLVFLVGKAGSGKTKTLREIADSLDIKVINLNLLLSAEMLDMTAKQRTLKLPGLLEKIAREQQTPLVLDNLEILFDRGLRQDPLRLLQGLSRNRTVLASWSGYVKGGKLFYAEQGHPEYRSYETDDLLLVNILTATPNDLRSNICEEESA